MKSELFEELCWISPIGEAVDDALKFIESIQDDLPLPKLGLTEAQDVTFEWAKNARRIVTAIVDGSGMVHYSALIGDRKVSGRYCLEDGFSNTLRDLIERVLPEEVAK